MMNNKNKEDIWIQEQLNDIEKKRKSIIDDMMAVEILSERFSKEKSREVSNGNEFNISERCNYVYLIYLSTIGKKGQRIYKFGKTYRVMNRFHE
jgi:hypothetical protein